jgi:hypothetical protein
MMRAFWPFSAFVAFFVSFSHNVQVCISKVEGFDLTTSLQPADAARGDAENGGTPCGYAFPKIASMILSPWQMLRACLYFTPATLSLSRRYLSL